MLILGRLKRKHATSIDKTIYVEEPQRHTSQAHVTYVLGLSTAATNFGRSTAQQSRRIEFEEPRRQTVMVLLMLIDETPLIRVRAKLKLCCYISRPCVGLKV